MSLKGFLAGWFRKKPKPTGSQRPTQQHQTTNAPQSPNINDVRGPVTVIYNNIPAEASCTAAKRIININSVNQNELRKLNKIELYQSRFSSWNGAWNGDVEDTLREFREFSKKLETTELHDYCVLLEGYFLLKVGSKIFMDQKVSIKGNYGPLWHLAGSNKHLSSPAKWVLARLQLSELLINDDPSIRHDALCHALKFFSDVSETPEFRIPIFLPGINSEFSTNSINVNLEEPRVLKVEIPHRYISSFT